MSEMNLPGSRARGSPKRGYMVLINKDMVATMTSERDTSDRRKWKEAIRCGDP